MQKSGTAAGQPLKMAAAQSWKLLGGLGEMGWVGRGGGVSQAWKHKSPAQPPLPGTAAEIQGPSGARAGLNALMMIIFQLYDLFLLLVRSTGLGPGLCPHRDGERSRPV